VERRVNDRTRNQTVIRSYLSTIHAHKVESEALAKYGQPYKSVAMLILPGQETSTRIRRA
jgi:hypothetical protein